MKTHSALKRLYDLAHQKNRKRNLETAFRLREALGCPDLSFSSVHVAGTNGKGSVSLKIAKGLELAGYKVGLYTSPHISSFRERIVLQGKPIPEAKFLELLERLFSYIDRLSLLPSFFEVTTLLAFLYFAEERVDFTVVEVGLGGRLDTTNFITPKLSVITSIGLDHTYILGNSLEEIAFEKAGIIKDQVPVVIGPHAHYQSIYQAAKEKKSAVIEAPSAPHPFYDVENTLIAETALTYLQVPKIAFDIRPPCRFERIGNAILDVAHNPPAFQKLAMALRFFYPNQKFRFLLGFSDDKDKEGCLDEILPLASFIHLVKTDHARLSDPEKVRELLIQKGFSAVHASQNLKEELAQILQKNELVVIAGSFFIMKEVREFLEINDPKDEFPLSEQYSFHPDQGGGGNSIHPSMIADGKAGDIFQEG